MIPVGMAVTRAALMSDEDFVRSEIYNEIVKPQNGFHAVYARRAGPWSSFVFAVCRPPLADAFESAETATMQSLLPHLTTAVELHQRLQIADRRQLVLARALDQLNVGVILTDASARPSFVNACAVRIVTESGALKLDDAGLAATTQLATRQLREAILAASADTAIKSRELRLQQPSHRLPLLLTLVPIFRLDPTVPGVRAPRVAIFIKEPGAVPAIDRDAVGETFRLTRRETDVAILLGGGLSLDQIAAKLGLGVGTVRHHLKRTFDKSGAHTQAALVALVRGFDLLG
jgi:DNA-binding CsgD family transcriptional regulator